jgi:hypothetical protein
MTGKYVVHRFDINMSREEDRKRLEEFLGKLKGDVVTITPNLSGGWGGQWPHVDFLLIIERLPD